MEKGKFQDPKPLRDPEFPLEPIQGQIPNPKSQTPNCKPQIPESRIPKNARHKPLGISRSLNPAPTRLRSFSHGKKRGIPGSQIPSRTIPGANPKARTPNPESRAPKNARNEPLGISWSLIPLAAKPKSLPGKRLRESPAPPKSPNPQIPPRGRGRSFSLLFPPPSFQPGIPEIPEIPEIPAHSPGVGGARNSEIPGVFIPGFLSRDFRALEVFLS